MLDQVMLVPKTRPRQDEVRAFDLKGLPDYCK